MNKIAKNASWIILCKIAQSVLTLVVNLLTARYFGPMNYGLITYAASLTAFVVPIMQLGFSNVLVREIVDFPQREGKTLGTSITLSLISSVCCMIGLAFFVVVANPNEPVTFLVCVLYSFVLVFQALELVLYWFQAKLLSKYTSLVSLCAFAIVSVYRILLLITKKSIYWFAISNAFDFAIIAFVSLALYRRLGGQKLGFSPELGRQMFAKSKYYIVSSMMVTIFAQTDKIMLKLMLNETMTGYYGAAVTCASMMGFVIAAIIDSFRPAVFEAQREDTRLFERRMVILYSLVIYISLAQSLVIAAFAPLIVRILYGSAFMPAGSALRIVVWYTTFSYLGAVRNIWILANDQQRHLWKINLSGAMANVLLNLVLIPRMGIDGAALASLVTQFFTNVVTGYLLAPIRDNNRLMLLGCNPKYLLDAVRSIKR